MMGPPQNSQHWFLHTLQLILRQDEDALSFDAPTDEARDALREVGQLIASGHVWTPTLSKQEGEALRAELDKADATMGTILIAMLCSWQRRLEEPGVVPLFGGNDSFVRLPESSTSAALEGTIAVSLLGSLEAFPDASVDVVLDVRERIQASRVHFRAAIAEAAHELAEDGRTHKDQAALVRDLRVRLVDPAVQTIREELEALGARRTLARVAAEVRTVAAGASWLSMGTASVTGIAELSASLAAAPLAPAIAAVAKEVQVRQEALAGLRRRPFWMLVEAQTLLRAR